MDSALQSLEGFVVDEERAVSFKWLAYALHCNSNYSKQLLFHFAQTRGESLKLRVTYLLAGRLPAASPAMGVRVPIRLGGSRARLPDHRGHRRQAHFRLLN